MPVLERLGSHLIELTLEKFKFVDVDAIGENCPKLQVSDHLKVCNASLINKISADFETVPRTFFLQHRPRLQVSTLLHIV